MLNCLSPPEWTPITLFSKFNIGAPEEPALVEHLWINLYFLSVYIVLIIPYDTDNSPSGYWIV